jgi:hypothetical protein
VSFSLERHEVVLYDEDEQGWRRGKVHHVFNSKLEAKMFQAVNGGEYIHRMWDRDIEQTTRISQLARAGPRYVFH